MIRGTRTVRSKLAFFLPVPVLAEQVAVVAVEHNYGFVCQASAGQGSDKGAHMFINVGHGCTRRAWRRLRWTQGGTAWLYEKERWFRSPIRR